MCCVLVVINLQKKKRKSMKTTNLLGELPKYYI